MLAMFCLTGSWWKGIDFLPAACGSSAASQQGIKVRAPFLEEFINFCSRGKTLLWCFAADDSVPVVLLGFFFFNCETSAHIWCPRQSPSWMHLVGEGCRITNCETVSMGKSSYLQTVEVIFTAEFLFGKKKKLILQQLCQLKIFF